MNQAKSVAQSAPIALSDKVLLSHLQSPAGIREKTAAIYAAALAGNTHFAVHEDKLDDVTNYVLSVIKDNYPSLEVPYHSRWRHFEVGNQFQLRAFQSAIAELEPLERARVSIDMIIPSVLLDAGAGPNWTYSSRNSLTLGRSEGLALASLDMFLAGGFSARNQLETTASGLAALTPSRLAEYFTASDTNPLVAIEGRVELMHGLANCMRANPEFFPNERPSDLVNYIAIQYGDQAEASEILTTVLEFFSAIWPGRILYGDKNLGDTWSYSPWGNGITSYVPFHKLSQWLSYSIIETLDNNGFKIQGVNALTGLAEYRNGGLMLDSGLISLRNPELAQQAWATSSDLIIEWRALTVCLLDKLGKKIADALGKTPDEFPLAKVLEGGTWAAGRRLAITTRGDLSPPLQIISDGTVF